MKKLKTKVRGYLIDPERGTAEVVKIEPSFGAISELLGHRNIEMTTQCVGTMTMTTIFCDEDGKLKEGQRCSAAYKDYMVALVGKILCMGWCRNGEIAGLNTATEASLIAHTKTVRGHDGSARWQVLMDLNPVREDTLW